MNKAKKILTIKISKLSKFFETDVMYIIKSGFWMNLNFIFISLFGLLTSILFANFVSKDDYGTYQFILSVAGTIAVFVPSNMNSAVLRSVAKGNEGDLISATKFQIRWGIIGTIISICVSFWYILNQNLGLSISFLIIAILMPTSYALNTWGAFLQGKKDYRRFFIFNSIATVISYGGIIATIFISKDYLWLAVANIGFNFLSNLILFYLTIKILKPNSKTDSETITYGKNLSIMGIPTGITSQLDALLIFHFMGAAPLAVYSFATLLPEKLTGGLKFISTIIFPKFSEKSEDDVRSFFNKKIWWLVFFVLVTISAYIIAVPKLFSILFPSYMESINFTRVYSLSFFSIISSVIYTALLSQKKMRDLYIMNLSTPIVKSFLMIVLMINFNIWGIIWAQIITIFFQIFFPIYLFNKK